MFAISFLRTTTACLCRERNLSSERSVAVRRARVEEVRALSTMQQQDIWDRAHKGSDHPPVTYTYGWNPKHR